MTFNMRTAFFLYLFFPLFTFSQIDHWETVVLPSDDWKYLVPTSQPNLNWNQLEFNASSWNSGPSGFGFGDDDDATVIFSAMSVYIRKTFEITDASAVGSMVLDIDYDDGFVAYLNGQEIARNLIFGENPEFDQPIEGSHEAMLYQGYAPERFEVDPSLLNLGKNILAVQVHNRSNDSSDLSALPVLSLGINNTSTNYSTPPSWFVTPYVPVEVNFVSSNLPIVVIETNQGQEIPNEPKIAATMKIIYRDAGARNFLTDVSDASTLNYDGAIKIEVRGSSSSILDKKQYAFTPYDDLGEKINVSLLDMPKENDWILNGLAYDASFIRDFLSYKLSNLIGNYASRGRYCEVVLNGEFRGIYVLQEKLKADDSRIDINKIKESQLTLPKLTGGYITKADKNEGFDTPAWYMGSYGWGSVNYIHEHPKPTTVQPEQNEYIKGQFESLQNQVNPPSNSSITSGYPSVIDVPSFVDFMILNEFASNADSYQFSTFFHKDRNGKLRAGPIWDFNLTFGNDLFSMGFDRSKTDVWQLLYGNMGSFFWTDLFNDPVFNCYFRKRWQALTAPGMPLNSSEIFTFIDETTALISEAAQRQEILSGTTGEFNQQISDIKTFISARIAWISMKLTEISESNNAFQCDNITTPLLVISKINYNPLVDAALDSDDYEFIEIKNNSTSTIDLTGIYFGGLGLTYQFENGATISGGESIFLSNKSESFLLRYGFNSFGEFSRNLSNDSEDLVLRDAYGNIIDEVKYKDVVPWPEDADGNGSFLKLVSVDLDNSLASSWVAQNDTAENLSVNAFQYENLISLAPNPVSDKLKINSANGKISTITLWSVNGKLYDTYNLNSHQFELDMSHFENGLYLLQIQTDRASFVKKIIKN